MLNTKVMNDIRGTFLLIMSEETYYSGHEMKMFENNDIKGFLPVSLIRVNNSISYEYRLMDYENLHNRISGASINIEELKSIFAQITSLVQRAKEYLLDVDSIILSPEYIYYKRDEYYFCYYPSLENAFIQSIRELMEYFLERLDHSRQNDVLIAYNMYQKILKGNFTMESLMEEFFVNEEEKIVKKTENTVYIRRETPPVNTENKLEIKEVKKSFWSTLFGRKKSVSYEELDVANTMLLAESSIYAKTPDVKEHFLENQNNGDSIPLKNFPIKIGNGLGDANCVINNQMVSRNHALITFECGAYYVEDEASTNGTFVNGSRISPYEPVEIKEGDVVAFANEVFTVN